MADRISVITIHVDGGIVSDITGIPQGTILKVRDYDVDNYEADDPNVHRDVKTGEWYHLSTWSHDYLPDLPKAEPSDETLDLLKAEHNKFMEQVLALGKDAHTAMSEVDHKLSHLKHVDIPNAFHALLALQEKVLSTRYGDDRKEVPDSENGPR